jgi:fumarate reductase subunit D
MENTSYKSGFKTSEFWAQLMSSVVGILVMLGYIEPQQADELTQAVTSVIGGLMVLVPMSLYILSRLRIKQESIKSSIQSSRVLGIPGVEEPDAAPQTYVLP